MFEVLSTLFSYSFMMRALLAGALVALCAALLGVSLVLKRYSMIGDGLSHVGFGALSVATALNFAPMAVAMPVVLLSAFLLLRISGSSRIKSDAEEHFKYMFSDFTSSHVLSPIILLPACPHLQHGCLRLQR